MTSSDLGLSDSFYSHESFKFHPRANRFDLLSSTELRRMGASIAEEGQKEPIELFKGLILDGRNRYLACKLFNVKPHFIHLPENINPRKHVIAKNVYRRHLPTAQLADLALDDLEEEKKMAKDRKLSHLIQNHKNTDGISEIRSEKKGKAIEIVANDYSIGQNSIRIAMKVKMYNDPEINELWTLARKKETTVKSVEELIKKKFPPLFVKKSQKKSIKSSQSSQKLGKEPTEKSVEELQKKSNKSSQSSQKLVEEPTEKELQIAQIEKVEKILKAKKKYNVIDEKWKELKEGKISLEELANDVDKVEEVHEIAPKTLIKAEKIEKASKTDPEIKEKWKKALEKEMTLEEVYKDVKKKNETKLRKGIINKFIETGHKLTKKETENIVESPEDICRQCDKATVFAVTCEVCGHLTSRVLCDNDFINNTKRLVNPNRKKCSLTEINLVRI